MMNKNNLIKTSTLVHRCVRELGNVEYFITRYADPRKPRITKLFVINGKFEFKRQRDASSFVWRLADDLGGSGPCTMKSYDTIIKSYNQEDFHANCI